MRNIFQNTIQKFSKNFLHTELANIEDLRILTLS